MEMRILGIIPARYDSTRFPGKPLAKIDGKSMIHRVYEQATQAKRLSFVIVATDDERIFKEVQSFGGKVLMTDRNHVSGTDRCAEALSVYEAQADAVINIQGDEPFIAPEQIDLVAGILEEGVFPIATLVKEICDLDELNNPNLPKVVLGSDGSALYFSRQPIPYVRNTHPDNWLTTHTFYKHIGIYGYTTEVLPKLTALGPGLLEQAENLEQLRWLENGYRIGARVTTLETISVDTPSDLERAEAWVRAR
jgi:3-deoxy-manno-octulosonate cytidylyltransferase (CMP-KDO synthetase)